MNITTNGLSSWDCSSLVNWAAETIGTIISYSLILVVSVVGNSLIGINVYNTPNLRKPTNFLTANMAMSDLLFPIVVFHMWLIDLQVVSWPVVGPLGQILCKVPVSLAEASTLVSVQSLVLIAVDRFGAVVIPLHLPLISRKLCPFYILATWIVAVGVVSPLLFANKLVEYQGGIRCDMQWEEVFGEKSFPTYFLTGVSVFFYIPMVLLVLLYSIILIKLKKQAHPGEPSANVEEQRTKTNRNVMKMVVAIVSAFFLCWIPFHTIFSTGKSHSLL